MNHFGQKFRFSTFGESHGKAIGCIVEGVPAGLQIDVEYIQSCLDRRKPGQNSYATARKESDCVEILSGVFAGKATGTPIAMVIYNSDQKSKDYESIKDIFRPGHADFTYFHKYGIRDYRGGGRSSARESAARVAAGGIAKLLLKNFGISVASGVYSVGDIEAKSVDFSYAKTSPIYTVCKEVAQKQKELIEQVKKQHDSIGGSVRVKASNIPVGLGEPMYYKLDGAIGEAMMGLNGVKAVEIGDGVDASKNLGSQNNDLMDSNGFKTNHSGGVLGGISTGQDLEVAIYFKPTPSIFQPQQTLSTDNEQKVCELKGRHDPCIAIRGSVVCEAMVASIIADMLLLNATSKLENLVKIYG